MADPHVLDVPADHPSRLPRDREHLVAIEDWASVALLRESYRGLTRALGDLGEQLRAAVAESERLAAEGQELCPLAEPTPEGPASPPESPLTAQEPPVGVAGPVEAQGGSEGVAHGMPHGHVLTIADWREVCQCGESE